MCSQQIPYSLAGISFVVTMITLAIAQLRLLILNSQTDGIFLTTTTLRYVCHNRVHVGCMYQSWGKSSSTKSQEDCKYTHVYTYECVCECSVCSYFVCAY